MGPPNIIGLSYVLTIMGLFYVPEIPYTKGLSYVQLVLKLPDLPHTPPTLHKMDPYNSIGTILCTLSQHHRGIIHIKRTTSSNIKVGFMKCGIHPFNPSAISKEKMVPSTLHGTSSSLESSVDSSDSVIPQSTPSSSQTLESTPSPQFNLHSHQALALVQHLCHHHYSAPPVFRFLAHLHPLIVNPLVSAGLIPDDLSDILAIPPPDAAVEKKRTKRITGARDLTADDYHQMLLEDERKKKEAEELKQQKKEEREKKN